MNNFKKFRLKNNFTSVVETSKILNISPSYLWSIENNSRFPSIKVLKKFAKVYNCEITEFL